MAPISRPVLVLSLDGGGIRGQFQAQVLKYLRDGLAIKLGQPELELNDVFDVISGTSTGGILACGLTATGGTLGTMRGAARTDMLASLYERYGRDIFAQRLRRTPSHLFRRKYKAKALEAILQEYLGVDATLGEAGEQAHNGATRLLVPSYDTRQGRIRWFDNHGWRSTADIPHNTPLWEVARATSAAPSYFGAARLTSAPDSGPWIDGGVGANDPSGYAATVGLTLLMARRLSNHEVGIPDAARAHPFVRVVSIGNTSVSRSRAVAAVASAGGGILPWLPFLPGLLMRAHAGTASDVMGQLQMLVNVPDDPRKAATGRLVRLHRILPLASSGKSVGLDAASRRSLRLLTNAATAATATKRRFDSDAPAAVVARLADDCG